MVTIGVGVDYLKQEGSVGARWERPMEFDGERQQVPQRDIDGAKVWYFVLALKECGSLVTQIEFSADQSMLSVGCSRKLAAPNSAAIAIENPSGMRKRYAQLTTASAV